MARKVQKIVHPDYKRIYTDIINKKYPEKEKKCQSILSKKTLSVMDLMKLNTIIFNTTTKEINQKFKAYDRETILEILNYQIKNKLNNKQLAYHFQTSRNTITKWKRLFPIDNKENI
ncbi:transposase [Chryseobacterium sp. FH2]|uniref:hypothetical protein n=1 Tax=Chryseobacterium sp. FH2 TaxID=1674291 RepID=UPI00065AF956|nr:hypothetical protein [Chryseobacterium sp. FH2]KMQ68927.1 transposase [Chryseobacterium sp. FH2]